jgi:hypothetical protein
MQLLKQVQAHQLSIRTPCQLLMFEEQEAGHARRIVAQYSGR